MRVHGRDTDEVRLLMLGQRLPLPGYLRSDGTEMVPADLFALADEAGGVELLEPWFTAHWADPVTGKAEWNAYLSGHYVCLHSVSQAAIQRNEFLTAAIGAAANEPDARSAQWLERLHVLGGRTRRTGNDVHGLRPSSVRRPHLPGHLHRRHTRPISVPMTLSSSEAHG